MTYRVYFNRRSEAPFVWSIDEGSADTEITVRSFSAGPGCELRSCYTGEVPNENTPVAWLEVDADALELQDRVARFESQGLQPIEA